MVCACVAAAEGLRRYYLWWLNRRLPQGIRFCSVGPLDVVGYYEILDRGLLKRHAKALIHPTAGARVYMGGLREENILCSPGGAWERQRAIIHPFIGTHAGQYLTLLQNSELVFQDKNGRIDLLEEVGRYVAHISTTPMGLEIEGGFRWRDVTRFSFFVGASLYLGPFERLSKFVLRKMLPFLHLEQQITKFVNQSDSSFVRNLTAEFGKHETVGHIWAIVNGSVIPETNMICSIMHELGEDPASQDAVYEMICNDSAKTVMHNALFDEWVATKCREHAFFRSTSRVAEEDFVVDGYTIPKGASLRIPIAKLNDVPGVSLTWGFGKRTCPGAQIGKNIIKFTIFRIVTSFRVGLERQPWNLKTDNSNFYPFGLPMTSCKRGDCNVSLR